MEQNVLTRRWLRSAYIVFGIVFVTLIGGLVQILDLSDHINYGLVKFLEKNPEGLELHGKYLFPKNWLTFCVIILMLMLLFPATSLLKPFVEERSKENKDESTHPEAVGLRQDLDDAIRFARNITSYIYPVEERNQPRLDVISVHLKYIINSQGDTDAEAKFEIECVKDPAHFFNYWVRSDPQSGEIKFLRQLNIQAYDVETGQKLDWLPTQNEPNTKAIAIFFPEVAPGMRKKIEVTYVWPRLMGKLLDLGAVDFDWYHLTHDPERTAYFRQEWIFDASFAPLECRTVGPASPTATLWQEQRGATFACIYEDKEARMASKRVVEFVSVQKKL